LGALSIAIQSRHFKACGEPFPSKLRVPTGKVAAGRWREVAQAGRRRYMLRGAGESCAGEDLDMRTEIENAVSEIKQGITLLRRHL